MTHMRNAFVAAIVLLAACAPLPPKPEPVACPAQVPCPVCPACPPAKPLPEAARYIEARFDALPGWPSSKLDQSLRTFFASCPRPGALAKACALAAAVSPRDEQAARAFFESAFVPYALVSSDGPDTSLITGHYEPVT